MAFRISLFKVGLVAMLFFVFASNVLNYVSIATHAWGEDNGAAISLWYACNPYNTGNRAQCLNANPPALLATGTALNCLSLVLIAVAQVALCVNKFKDSVALYFVIGALLTTLLSLVFNSIGWFFAFHPQYQQLNRGNNNVAGFNLGWSFWLMTPSFATSIIAALIGSAILGCTCVENRSVVRGGSASREQNLPHLNVKNTSYTIDNNQVFYDYKANDQVLRL